jgi:hypothetical protein
MASLAACSQIRVWLEVVASYGWMLVASMVEEGGGCQIQCGGLEFLLRKKSDWIDWIKTLR